MPWRPGVAAARRSERPRARRVLLLHDDDQHRLAAHGRVGAARAGTGSRVLELPARRRPRCAADGDLRLESPPGIDDPGAVLRDPQPGRRDRRSPGAAPVRLPSPAVHSRGDPGAAALGRRERCQSHALLWRLLALWVSRGWACIRRSEWPARSESSGDRLGTLRRHAASSAVHARRARLHVSAVHGAARCRSRAAADEPVSADQPQSVELGELRRSRSSRRSEPPAQGTARRRRDAPRDRAAGGSHLPADTPAVSRLRLQSGLVLLLLRSRGAAAGRPCRGEQHLRRNPQLLAAARSGVAHVSRRRHQVALRLAVHAGRPRVHVRLHAAGGPPGGPHGDQSGRLGRLRRDAVARAPALERGGDPAGARALSGDDRHGHGGDSLAGAEVVVEGRARRAACHGGRRGRTRGPRGRDGGPRPVRGGSEEHADAVGEDGVSLRPRTA